MNQTPQKKGFRRATGRQVLARTVAASAAQPARPTVNQSSTFQRPTSNPTPAKAATPSADPVRASSVSPAASSEPTPAPTPKQLPLKYYLILAPEGQFPVCQEYASEAALVEQLKQEVVELRQAAQAHGDVVSDTRLFVFVGHIAELGTFPEPRLFLPPLLDGESEKVVKLYEEETQQARRSCNGSLFAANADKAIYRAIEAPNPEADADEEAPTDEEPAQEAPEEELPEPEEPSMAALMDSLDGAEEGGDEEDDMDVSLGE